MLDEAYANLDAVSVSQVQTDFFKTTNTATTTTPAIPSSSRLSDEELMESMNFIAFNGPPALPRRPFTTNDDDERDEVARHPGRIWIESRRHNYGCGFGPAYSDRDERGRRHQDRTRRIERGVVSESVRRKAEMERGRRPYKDVVSTGVLQRK